MVIGLLSGFAVAVLGCGALALIVETRKVLLEIRDVLRVGIRASGQERLEPRL